MKLKRIYLIFSVIIFMSCEESDSITNTNENVIIDANQYQKTNTNNYTIIDVKLEGDLLTIKIGASGCSSESWKAILVDSSAILESNPLQRNIKLNLENNEACLAYFEVEYTFNIQSLTQNLSPIYFNLEGWNTQILHE